MSARAAVWITGAGIISCLGRGTAAHTEAARSGRIGIDWIRSFDTEGFSCRIAGSVDDARIDSASAGHDRFVRLALVAATEAANAARLDDPALDRIRIGTLLGTGMGGMETLDQGFQRLYGRGQSRLPPTLIPRSMYNAATSAVSAELQAEGPALSIVSACASATHAIGQAALWIRAGMADVVIAGGSDAPLTPAMIRGWEALRVLAPAEGEPAGACRPFSADRNGMVLAEGAGVVVLESRSSAERRGRDPLGEILGFGLSSDAGHLTDPSPGGAARAMSLALADAGIGAEEVGYVNAHGTGTRANDPAETAALHGVFGRHAAALQVSSTKAMHGHAMGAAGAIELILSLLSLNAGVIPPTMN
ncbi:MAG TPA: beta-ketoacyl-[acyl-carrier-protein] synthase family protein, partial [Thermoanaerobaculia bacterium]|nr:beta-ketoacyl-[acyl-carrier-protein] synthase family protein [Thermoanaerobaculia bacterium]